MGRSAPIISRRFPEGPTWRRCGNRPTWPVPKTRAPTPKESKPPPDPIVPSTSMLRSLRVVRRRLPAGQHPLPDARLGDQSLRYAPVHGILWNLLILVLMVASSSWHLAGFTDCGCRRSRPIALRRHSTVCGLTTSHFRRGLRRRHRHGAAALLTGMLLVFRQWTLEGTRRVLLGPHSHSPLGVLWLLAVVVVPILLEWIRSGFSTPQTPSSTVKSSGPGPWLPRVDQYGRRRADSLVRHQSLADVQAGWDEVPAGPRRLSRPEQRTCCCVYVFPL